MVNMGFKSIQKKVNSKKIEAAITDFENQIDFEFIPIISKKSSYVEHIRWIISLLFLILFMGLIDYIFANHLHDTWMSPLPFLIAGPFLAVVCGALLEKSHPISRFFITKNERVRQVQERAERVFFKKQLHEINSQNALLLYISIMERQIVLFHDPRIQFEKMPQINQQLLKILQESFKSHSYEEGLLKAIAYLKAELLPHFPIKNGVKGENFVPNKLIWWDE